MAVRPIDADAMYQRYCVDKRGLDGIYDTTDLHDMLKEMPTIDAIPVEWLCKKIREEDERGNIPHAKYITDLIWEWHQEEQEVQNG